MEHLAIEVLFRYSKAFIGDGVNDKFMKTATDLNRELTYGVLDAGWLPPGYFTWMEIKGWYDQRKTIVGEFCIRIQTEEL